MKINFIGVPLFYGCDKKGANLGPNDLRQKGVIELLEKNNHTVYDLGNLHVPEILESDKFAHHNKMKYLNSITKVNTNLAHQVYSSLESKSFPLIIGGDHSLGLGSISGASKYHDNLAVVWIDAHGDINTHDTSPSGNVHGMPLAAAMGVGHNSLTDIYFHGQKVKPENVFILGARDLDEGELKLIEELNLNLFTTEDIRNLGLEEVMNRVQKTLAKNKVEAIHVSYDIDSLDSELVPGTGTPVADGLTVEECKYMFKILFGSRLVKSMDFVELNTELEEGTSTINVCMELIDYIAKYL
jgi:arginase